MFMSCSILTIIFCRGNGDPPSSLSPGNEGKVAEDVGTASLSVGLTMLLEESLPFSTGGGGPLSSLSPATEGEEVGDMGGIAEEFLPLSTGSGGISSLSPATEGEEAEDMVDKVTEDEATASLSAALALLVEESLFCTGCGLSSFPPAAEGTEAGDMVGKVAEDVSRASLSVGPILTAE